VSVVQDGLDLGFRQLTVASVDRLTADSVAITFDVPPELHEQFRFRAGQHLTLRRVVAGADVRRTYSVCSSAAGGPLRVAVKRLPGGAFSSRIVESVRAGDVVDVLPPAGRFGPAVDPTRARHYGLMAAGSGVTPLLSIACTVLDVEPQSEVTLLYANRTSAEVMFLDELAELKDRHPTRLQLLHVLSREQQEPELLSGRLDRDRVTRLLSTLVSADAIDEWYLCGPFTMVTGARQALHEAGVEPAAVHVELFFADPLPSRTPPPPRASTELATVTVVLHGRASTVQVDPVGAPILDAVLAVRADAPYACRGGVCGTCRARCTGGAVSLDVNWALEPDELAAGVVLTCQAHPATPEVRLEYL
jgi:ring-1,2-phenylacetyl-CoA epoxidase subunit PaaE